MVSAVLSHDEVISHERCSQRRFGFSLITAVALHLALFVVFINFSFNAQPPELMMPASQVIKASLVMSAPKPIVKSNPVKTPVPVQKAKPAQVPKQKLVAKNLASVIPEPVPKPKPDPLPVPRPEPEPEAVQTAVETQQQSLAIETVDKPVEAVAVQPHQASIVEEPYVPPSINVAYYHNPKPRYPKAAKRRGMEGVVELQVTVDSRGNPAAIEIKQSSGFQVLDREAIKAVWQWRFQAAKRGGLAVVGEVIVPVRYQLDSA